MINIASFVLGLAVGIAVTIVFALILALNRPCIPLGIDAAFNEMDLPHYCADCGAKLQVVRPGVWQCPRCE